MKKLWAMIKNNPEVAGYVGLVLLVFGACFFVEFSFVAALYIVLFAFFLRNEVKILGLIVFINCFYMIFHVGNFQVIMEYSWSYFSLINTLLDVLYVFVFLLYIKRVIRKEKKINLKLFIPIILFLIYMALPFHECEWTDLTNVACSYLCLYVAFEIRHEIDFVYLVRIFALALILSCVFGFYNKISLFLDKHMNLIPVYFLNKFRYPGLTFHPLHLASLCMLLISCILVLKYKNKISSFEFYLIFIPVFVFGYLTISRSFIVTVFVAVIIFGILYFFKNKKESYKFIFSLLMVIGLITVLFLGETRCLFMRFEYKLESKIPIDASEDWWMRFFEGDISVELNRKDIYKYYIIDWSSSLQTILFGRGISRLSIGGLNAHNIFLQRIWEHGFIGYVFYLIIFISVFNIKKIKNNRLLEISILLIPFLCFSMVEVLHFEYIGLFLAIASMGWLDQINETKKNNIKGCISITSNEIIQTSVFDNYNLVNNLKLSIIIPVYNGEKFIQRCIDKVLKIELIKEIIVINDGSTDNSLELLKSYGDQIILINLEHNKGVSHARNLGLERASGDYVSFIDIDDDFELNMHQKILDKMITHDADIGICRFDNVNADGSILNRESAFGFVGLSQYEVIKKYLLHKLTPCIWTSIYTASLAKSISFENEVSFGEDTLYQLKILIKAKKTCFVDEVLYHYVKNNFSATNSNASPEKVISYLHLLEYLTKAEKGFLKNNFSNEFNFFKIYLLSTCLNMVSRWSKLNKYKYRDVVNFLKKIIDKDVCIMGINGLKYVNANKKLIWYIKNEFFILKTFGVKFYLFISPFLELIKSTYFKVKLCYQKILKK